MAQQGPTNDSDLVQFTTPSQKIQDLVGSLPNAVRVDAMANKKSCSPAEYQYDITETLKEIWTEFQKEATTILDRIEKVVPGGNSLARGVRVLVFQAGHKDFHELVAREDGIVLLPFVISGSPEATIYDYTTKQQTSITLTTRSQLLLPGRCAMRLGEGTIIVCVVLGLGKDKPKENKVNSDAK